MDRADDLTTLRFNLRNKYRRDDQISYLSSAKIEHGSRYKNLPFIFLVSKKTYVICTFLWFLGRNVTFCKIKSRRKFIWWRWWNNFGNCWVVYLKFFINHNQWILTNSNAKALFYDEGIFILYESRCFSFASVNIQLVKSPFLRQIFLA